VQILERKDRVVFRMAIAALAGGTILSMLGPIIAFGIVCLVAVKNGGTVPGWAGFWLTTAIVLPLTIAVGYSYRGGLTASAAEGASDWDSPLTYGMRGRAMAGLLVIDVILVVASLAGFGIRRLRTWGELEKVSRSRAAELLAQLFLQEQGQPFSSLMRPGEAWEEFRLTVDYLLLHELVGASQKRKVLWLSSDARAMLEATVGGRG
jgi:hypothetical protein